MCAVTDPDGAANSSCGCLVHRPLLILLATTLAVSCAQAQPVPDTAPHAFSITRSDPALDALISPDARLRTVASGFGFIDGPVWIAGRQGAGGFLLASSIIDNVIYKVTPAGKVSVYLDQAARALIAKAV
jgi:gluconolactonase